MFKKGELAWSQIVIGLITIFVLIFIVLFLKNVGGLKEALVNLFNIV